MKSTGIVRKIDQLGRLVVPMELRKTLELEIGEPIEIFTKGDTIILKKYQKKCIFCDNEEREKLYTVGGKVVCHSCLNKLRNNMMIVQKDWLTL